MEKPNIITRDLTNCRYPLELHQRIQEAFDFPDFYVRNWDAFWDLIRRPRNYTVVEIKGLHTMPEESRYKTDANAHAGK